MHVEMIKSIKFQVKSDFSFSCKTTPEISCTQNLKSVLTMYVEKAKIQNYILILIIKYFFSVTNNDVRWILFIDLFKNLNILKNLEEMILLPSPYKFSRELFLKFYKLKN
jgi:hypothetical protein